MQTIVLGMMEFNVQRTKHSIHKSMLKGRSKFGILPRVESNEEILQFTASNRKDSQSLRFEFVSGLDCSGAEKVLDRPSITADSVKKCE